MIITWHDYGNEWLIIGHVAKYKSSVSGQVSNLFMQSATFSASSIVITWLIGKLLDVTVGLRVTQDEEKVGLDIAQHGERAYGGFR